MIVPNSKLISTGLPAGESLNVSTWTELISIDSGRGFKLNTINLDINAAFILGINYKTWGHEHNTTIHLNALDDMISNGETIALEPGIKYIKKSSNKIVSIQLNNLEAESIVISGKSPSGTMNLTINKILLFGGDVYE